MTQVIDASLVVAGLVDSGELGGWAEQVLGEDHLAAPHLMPAQVTNILRRACRSGQISDDTAALAQRDLVEMSVEYFPYEPHAARIWELRENVTAYDAWYVAVAESLGAPLATLDRRLAKAPGPRCVFATPPLS